MASHKPPAAAAARTPRTPPTRWLAAYDAFITKNVGQVSQIESTLRSLTYIIPGRFRDAEMASEAIHGGVQLLSLYHDALLRGVEHRSSSASSITPPSPHARYTRYWTRKSSLYRRAATLLQVLRYTELLCEMAAKRRGERVRWRVVVAIEAAKAVCRLVLLRATGGRPTVTPPLPEREVWAGENEEEEGGGEEEEEEEEEEEAEKAEGEGKGHNHNAPPTPPLSPKTRAGQLTTTTTPGLPPSPPSTDAGAFASTSTSSPNHPWPMPRTGQALPPLPPTADITGYLLSRVLTADAIRPPATLLPKAQGPALAAEVLHILVPLVYALAMASSVCASGGGDSTRTRHTKSKLATWSPWLAAVGLEAAARQLRGRDTLRTTTLERDEWTRRGWALGWWAMRGACYEQVVQHAVKGVRARLPSFVGGLVEDYEYLWGNYYFSTSP